MGISSVDSGSAPLYGRLLVLLGIRNELRARRAPLWRRERNRIAIDRALAELADARHPRSEQEASRSRDERVPIASLHSSA